MKISHHLPVSMQSLVVELSCSFRTIAETNMALWTFGSLGQVNNDKPWVSLMRQAACGDEHVREDCNVHYLKRGAF